jgi:hypothetical protein
MRRLFGSSDRFVIIYSSNTDSNVGYGGSHVRHRRFTGWVEREATGFRLAEHIPGPPILGGLLQPTNRKDFFIYEKQPR